MLARIQLDGVSLGRRIINWMSGTKIIHILPAIVNDIKKCGFVHYVKDLLANPQYYKYKIFSINPKYLTSRLKATVDKEEELFHRYVKLRHFVLDAGCGDGRNGLKIVEELKLKPKAVVLFDISPDYLKKLSRFVRRSKNNCYYVVRGSIFDMGLSNEILDVVICSGAVLSLADGGSIEDGLLELKRVVKTGGTIIFHIITTERLIKTAEERGRNDIKENILRTGIYPNWNEQYREGICKGWSINEVNAKVEALGLEIVSKDVIYSKDVPFSMLLACRKKRDSL